MLFNGTLTTTTDTLRQTIRHHYRIDENAILTLLLPIASISAKQKSYAWQYARQLMLNIRQAQKGNNNLDALLNEFSLSTDEGLVLMCLAEALLRVPDKFTTDALIHDKLGYANWRSHIGNSESLFVNASSWALLLTGKVINPNEQNHNKQIRLLKNTIKRLGEPVIRQSVRYAMKIMGKQFVMGTDINDALGRAIKNEQQGYRYSYDMLGEGARTQIDADSYFDRYLQAVTTIGSIANHGGPEKNAGISIKLSALHPRYEFAQYDRVMKELLPKVKQLAIAAKQYNIGLTIDAEEANRLDISLDIIEEIYNTPELNDWQGFGLAVQAYQKRSLSLIEWLRALSLRGGRTINVRLVKGAYWDTEIKDSQVEGYHDFPVFTQKASTDVAYQACAKKLLEYRDSIYPQFATHNAYTAATIIAMAGDPKEGHEWGFEFQRLHGMGESLYQQVLTDKNIPCRIYAPVGQHKELLAYLVRRLLENGANSSFVNNIYDEKVAIDSLLIDPVETVLNWPNKRNSSIPQAIDLYQNEQGIKRQNSLGIDLTDNEELLKMQAALKHWCQQNINQAPQDSRNKVYNPANHQEVIGYIQHTDEAGMLLAVEQAKQAFTTWSQTPIQQRAHILQQIADTLAAHTNELIALCCKEAGKTIVDSLAEIREAIDFCRYYSARSQELFAETSVKPRGVVLCISPWNFPLAIFIGQVAAAIVTGNTVIAKAAEQTSLIALRTVELMQQAGLPLNVVKTIVAHGADVGNTLVPHSEIQAVMFTGSTTTAQWIAQRLAQRQDTIVPFIAETGGQNCMIVDSTALPEQVVDDVIASGFQSAGQRCSALRVLFLQEDIADTIITMLKGAMQELQLGDPSLLSTDVGPVIDKKALKQLNEHVSYLEQHGHLHFCCDHKQEDHADNNFFAPRLYELRHLSQLTGEVFGPIVHIIRYQAKQLPQVIEQINDTGFGLTMGIHSRIEQRCQLLAQQSRAGNIYVNRNMIGAVVGVQPFGGRGLSGTGPKAGGSMYLSTLVKDNNASTLSSKQQEQSNLTMLLNNQDPVSNINHIISQAKQAQKTWQSVAFGEKSAQIKHFLALLATYKDFPITEEILATTIAKIQHELTLIEQKYSTAILLPGPTGESNNLIREPRGVIACLYCPESDFTTWLASLLTAIVTGNSVINIVEDNKLSEAKITLSLIQEVGIPTDCVHIVSLKNVLALLEQPELSGVMINHTSPLQTWFNQILAQRRGPILPLIIPDENSIYLSRLTTEKTITINTTAAGGNADILMNT